MIDEKQQRTQPTSRMASTIVAALIHVALLLTALRSPRVFIAPLRLPGSALGTHISLAYLPGRSAQSAVLATVAPRPLAHRSVAAPVPRPTRETSTALSTHADSPSVSQPDTTHGNDALGTGDVSIALASSFPTPKPDLTSLPRGTSGDVVLDIVIDAAGKVTSITMSRGLGHGIDETVIATVQQWNFHPATRDGQPVPSEQELHFHYEKA